MGKLDYRNSICIFCLICLVSCVTGPGFAFTEKMTALQPPAAVVAVKLTANSDITVQNGMLTKDCGSPIASWPILLGEYSVQCARPTFTRSPEALKSDRQMAEWRTGRSMPDLTRHIRLYIKDSSRVPDLVAALLQNPEIENAYPVSLTAHLPSFNPTPDFSSYQEYLFSSQEGSPRMANAWEYDGGQGDGVKIVDIEYSCNRFHEDLAYKLGDPGTVIGGEPSQDQKHRDHGTAVAGLLVAEKDNGFGVMGICPDAEYGIYYPIVAENIANAVNLSQAVLQQGDVILLEVQVEGPDYTGNDQDGLVPAEYYDDVFEAIELATGLGITVVEASGNGKENLDDPKFEEKFNPMFRDSGAILVGAAAPFTREPMSYTNHGQRVNLHGWGSQVWTTGFGDAPGSPPAEDQFYTDSFSGTSSAAAMVAGAVVCFQGAANAMTCGPFDPLMVRDVLIRTGIPQNGQKHVGPIPDIGKAIGSIDVNVDLQISENIFMGGDLFKLWQTTYNPLYRDIGIQKYLIMDCMGILFFWNWDTNSPTFTQPPCGAVGKILACETQSETFLNFTWPEGDLGTGDNIYIYFGYLELFSSPPTLVGNIDYCVFGWR